MGLWRRQVSWQPDQRKFSYPLFRQGKFKKYYGRGAKQLSYNFNYGQFSQAMFGEGRLLLDYPDFVADTWLNLASATWFYTIFF